MHIDDIKRGLRAEIKKRENEQYATFQCNVRQMCKDVLAKLEEQESEITELKEQIEVLKHQACKMNCMMVKHYNEVCDDNVHHKYKRCLAMVDALTWEHNYLVDFVSDDFPNVRFKRRHRIKWVNRWLALAEKFKEAE